MTLAPARANPTPPGMRASMPAATVCAVLVTGARLDTLIETLDALTAQTHLPDELLIVDASPGQAALAVARAHPRLRGAISRIEWVRAAAGLAAQAAVTQALIAPGANGQSTGDEHQLPSAGHLWFLTDDTAPDPGALGRLLDALRRSPSVSVVGPKQLQWQGGRRLRAVGLQLTRTGRILPSPPPGEQDQGQYDQRTDVLAVPFAGMLVERPVFEQLGGFDPAFGELGSQLDLSWRAHQAGRRVVVVPAATVRSGARDDADHLVAAGAARRRQARRVALTRCALWAAPLMALWVTLTGITAALGLLVVKRPRAAWSELSDIGSVLDPWRTLAARWRSRGSRRVARRDLGGLFVTSGAALRHAGDLVHEVVTFDDRGRRRPGSEGEGLETGPSGDDTDVQVVPASWAGRVVRNPGFLAVLLVVVATGFAGRHISGGVLQRFEGGLAGGSLVGVRAHAATLWHTWLDGWHGGGTGGAGAVSPALVVLAALAWLGEHLPGVAPASSPAGAAVALLLVGALALATVTAYLSGRVVTRARWPRALAALAWAGTAVASTSVAAGRVGAVVALILLPPVAAGFARTAGRSGTATVALASALGAAVVGAFAPGLLVVLLVASLVVLLLGHGAARLRALVMLLVPPPLLGPWVMELVQDPRELLGGAGLTAYGVAAAKPWEIALLHPGGPGSYPVLLTVPLLVLAVLALLRGGSRSRALTALAVLFVVGLAGALLAPHVVLGTVPEGLARAGAPITMWAGLPLLLAALAVVAVALVGLADLEPRAVSTWLAALRWPIAALATVAAVAGAGAIGWWSFGSTLHSWHDPRPAVAVDQADSAVAGRVLFLQPAGRTLGYRLVGREVDGIARAQVKAPADDGLARVVAGLVDPQTASASLALALGQRAVGFVAVQGSGRDGLVRQLDAVGGLSRLGEHEGVLLWRVASPGTQSEAFAPSRLRLVSSAGSQIVPTTGQHAATAAMITAPAGARLVVAEAPGWATHAVVKVDGRALAAQPGQDSISYAVPPGRGHLTVQVLPVQPWWHLAQGLLLAVVAFLAIPFGRKASRRRS